MLLLNIFLRNMNKKFTEYDTFINYKNLKASYVKNFPFGDDPILSMAGNRR